MPAASTTERSHTTLSHPRGHDQHGVDLAARPDTRVDHAGRSGPATMGRPASEWRHHNRQAGRHPRGRDQPNSGDEPASTSPTSLGNGRNATTARLHAIPSAAARHARTDDRRGAVPPRAVLRRRTARHRAMTSSRGSPATTAIESIKLTDPGDWLAAKTPILYGWLLARAHVAKTRSREALVEVESRSGSRAVKPSLRRERVAVIDQDCVRWIHPGDGQ
jgi:hypothetical protein